MHEYPLITLKRHKKLFTINLTQNSPFRDTVRLRLCIVVVASDTHVGLLASPQPGTLLHNNIMHTHILDVCYSKNNTFFYCNIMRCVWNIMYKY